MSKQNVERRKCDFCLKTAEKCTDGMFGRNYAFFGWVYVQYHGNPAAPNQITAQDFCGFECLEKWVAKQSEDNETVKASLYGKEKTE